MRIIGIDPGFGKIGIGIIDGTHAGNWATVSYGCIETPAKKPFVDRLSYLKKELLKILVVYHPEAAGIEQLFFHTNTTTAMKVSEARGVILLTLFEAGIPIVEVTPLQMKQAMVGYGRAEKRQVTAMVMQELHLKKKPTPDDAGDALAIAITAGVLVRRLDRK